MYNKYIYLYLYVSIYKYDNHMVQHNSCFNLFILRNDSFDNKGSEISKSNIFDVSTNCLLRKISCYV